MPQFINHLNAELNPICHLLALLGAHHILHVSRIRVKYYFSSSVLNMFRTSIHPSSVACDFSVVSPHWLFVLVSMCVGVSVWQAEAQECVRVVVLGNNGLFG